MARVISQKIKEDIRFRNDIVDVIGAYVPLKKAGSGFQGLCPFHKEKTPSFHVNQQRQIYHCFGCNVGGDVFTFLEQIEGVSFTDAARILAQKAGITLELDDSDEEGASEKAILYRINSEIAEFYRRCLGKMKSAEKARAYLVSRELGEDAIEGFGIGYAPDRWDAAVEWADRKKYSLGQMEKAGLVIRNTNSGASEHRFYDRFRNRLMFPIRDEQGRVVAFSGRIMEGDEKTAKYVNSPETAVFQKGRILYALDKARRHIVDCRQAIVCEGQIDVIRCHVAGFTSAVASQGTAFTDDHTRMLRRYADSAVLVYDSDKAGQDAAIRTAGMFIEAGLAVRVGALPGGEDPDSFIRRNGGEAFGGILKQAVSAVAFQVSVLSRRENAGSEIGAMRIAKAVLQTIVRSPNAIQQEKLLEELASLLRVSIPALRDEMSKIRRRAGAALSDETPVPTRTNARSAEEQLLCEHIVHAGEHPALAALVEQYLPVEMISDACCRTLVKAALISARSGQDIQEALREEEDDSGDLVRLVAEMLTAPSRVMGNEFTREDAVKGAILGIWRRALKDERDKMERTQESDIERRSQLTYDLSNLKNWTDGADIMLAELAHRRVADLKARSRK